MRHQLNGGSFACNKISQLGGKLCFLWSLLQRCVEGSINITKLGVLLPKRKHRIHQALVLTWRPNLFVKLFISKLDDCFRGGPIS